MNRPEWLTIQVPNAENLDRMKKLLDAGRLHTVCEGADCPNIGECFAFGRIAGRNAARAGSHAAEQDARATQNQLGAEVVKAYLNIRKAREAVAAVEAGVKAYEAGVAAARARFEAGQMLKADLLSLEVQLAQIRENLSSARHGAALAGRAFQRGMIQPFDLLPAPLNHTCTRIPRIISRRRAPAHDIGLRPELPGGLRSQHEVDPSGRIVSGSAAS